MPTLTLKDVPPRLHQALKKRADRHRRSLNQEVLHCLERVTGLVSSGPEDREDWLRLSERALRRTWDNPQDDVYHALLKK